VVFLNGDDLAALGLGHGDVVDVEAVANEPGEPPRVLRGVTAVAYDIARGSAAAYYPEANGLVALDSYDERSGTPTYKSIPVVIRRAG
jgi:anaerobic selenocysteine-containing dehydrogenase